MGGLRGSAPWLRSAIGGYGIVRRNRCVAGRRWRLKAIGQCAGWSHASCLMAVLIAVPVRPVGAWIALWLAMPQ